MSMLYAIIAEDIEDSRELRQHYSALHRERLHQLSNEGRLVLAGPYPKNDMDLDGNNGFSGSLIVAEFESLAVAQAWAEEDPFKTKGVYAQVCVKPFKQFLP